MNNTWNKQQCDQIIEDIEKYFDNLIVPFTFCEEDREYMLDDISAMVLERFAIRGIMKNESGFMDEYLVDNSGTGGILLLLVGAYLLLQVWRNIQ